MLIIHKLLKQCCYIILIFHFYKFIYLNKNSEYTKVSETSINVGYYLDKIQNNY